MLTTTLTRESGTMDIHTAMPPRTTPGPLVGRALTARAQSLRLCVSRVACAFALVHWYNALVPSYATDHVRVRDLHAS